MPCRAYFYCSPKYFVQHYKPQYTVYFIIFRDSHRNITKNSLTMNSLFCSTAFVAAAWGMRQVTGSEIVYSELCDPFGADSFYEESIDLAKRVRRIRANSCPHHFNLCQQSECAGNLTFASHREVDIEIPLYPGIASEDFVKSVRCSTESVAISLNGVSIQSLGAGGDICGPPSQFGEQNGIGSACNFNGMNDGTRYCGDQVETFAAELDVCGGHADRSTGQYHYHVPPSCLLKDLGPRAVSTRYPSASQHSMQLGWAMDGFPVYGPSGPDGVEMKPCISAGHHNVLCLDSCNGYYGRLPGVDEYMYRYYITGPVGSGECSSTVDINGESVTCDREEEKCCSSRLPSVDFAPYTMGCFRGCAFNDRHCLLSDELEGTSEFFFPELSNYTAIYNPRSPAIVNPSVTPTAFEPIPTPTSAPTPTLPPDEVAITDSSRTVLQRVLSPYRGFSFVSSDAEGGLTVWALGGDTRDTSIIGGIALDNHSRRLYYTTQSVVAWTSTDGTEGGEVISGVTHVSITGYNFGSSVADVLSITVKGEPCLSIIFVNSGEVTCKLTRKITVKYVLPAEATTLIYTSSGEELRMVQLEDPFVVGDVTMICTTGRMTGIHEQPETVSRGRSGRMVIAAVEFTYVPHIPFAVAVSTPSNVSPNSVFWSDIGPAAGIYRAQVDGTQHQPVLKEAEAVNDLYIYERYKSSAGGCTDLMSCSMQSGESLDDAFPYSAALYDALFYVDASRKFTSGPSSIRNGVVGVLAVQKDGSLTDAPSICSKPDFYSGGSGDIILDACSVGSVSRGTISRDGVSFHTVDAAAGADILLVSGLYQPRSITVDESTGYALIVTTSGDLWRIDVFAALRYYSRIVTERPCCALKSSDQCTQLVVDVSNYALDKAVKLPEWLKVVFSSPITYSKFMGVSSIPLTASQLSDTGAVSKLKNERRVVVADANLNRLWMVDLWGSNYRYTELQQTIFGEASKVLHPTDIVARVTNRSMEIFVAEYLGKIWKLSISLDSIKQPDLLHSLPLRSSSTLSAAVNTKGSRASVLDVIPELIVDKSNFFVSNTARKLHLPPFLGSDN